MSSTFWSAYLPRSLQMIRWYSSLSARRPPSDVDAPRLGGEPEAHVERNRLRADLQHRGQRARILRRLHPKGREVLRRQLEGSSPLEGRKGSESWDPNDGRIAKLRMGGREPRQILHWRSRWARPI